MATAPSVESNAAEILRTHDLPCKQVIRVDTDSILFISGAGRAMTAWLTWDGAKIRLFVESGFKADRPAYAAPPIEAEAA